MKGGLDGIRIVEVAQAVAAPAATAILADFGAEVIHVEHPGRGDAHRRYFSTGGLGNSPVGRFNYVWELHNRNKKSIAIDIRSGKGQEIIYRLVEKSDVFMSNLRSYELERYKLTYEILSKLNQRLVYANLNGLGQKGQDTVQRVIELAVFRCAVQNDKP